MFAIRPENIQDFISLFTTDVNQINSLLLSNSLITFYDTCSIGSHARKNIQTNNYDILDFFTNDDIVIISDKILQEMINPQTNNVSQQYIDYLTAINEKVKSLVLLKECNLESLARVKFSTIQLSRICLNKNINNALKGSKLLKCDNASTLGITINDPQYSQKVFSVLDSYFPQNRGEVSMLIQMLIINSIRSQRVFRVLSDDINSVPFMLEPFVENKMKSDIIFQSTPKIFQVLRSTHWKTKGQQEYKTILDNIRTDQNQPIYFKKIIQNQVCLNNSKEKFSNEQLAKAICDASIQIEF